MKPGFFLFEILKVALAKVKSLNGGVMGLHWGPLKLALLLSTLASAPLLAQPKELKLEPAGTEITLRSRYGFLLLSLDVDGVSSSLEFSRLGWNKPEHPPERALKGRPGEDFTVSLQGLDNGLYILALPEGWYQITRVNAPYFDLPFWMDTAEEPSWRFRVDREKTNYAGQLFIARERSSKYVKMRLHNRLAAEIEQIQGALVQQLQVAPLASGSGVRDDFLGELPERSGP